MKTVVENETSMTEIEVFEDRIVLKAQLKEQPEKASHAYLGSPSNKITAGTITGAAITSNLIAPNAQITADRIESAEIGRASLKPIQTESQFDRIEKKVDRILALLEGKELSTKINFDNKQVFSDVINHICNVNNMVNSGRIDDYKTNDSRLC